MSAIGSLADVHMSIGTFSVGLETYATTAWVKN